MGHRRRVSKALVKLKTGKAAVLVGVTKEYFCQGCIACGVRVARLFNLCFNAG